MAKFMGTMDGDVLDGTSGRDKIMGLHGDDVLNGLSGDDRLWGDDGDDTLDGGEGDDILDGGRGDDELTGGEGNDELTGGDGFDTAIYAGSSGDYDIAFKTDATGRVVEFKMVTDLNTLDGDEGSDQLKKIEQIVFLDDGAVLSANGIQLLDQDGAFVGFFDTVKAAVDASSAGYTVSIGEGDFSGGSSQIVVPHDLNIVGFGKDESTIMAEFDTGSSGNARGWFLVNDGATLHVEDVAFDGNDHKIWQAFRHLGSGTFDKVAFTDIEFQESGSPYAGTAIAVFGPASDVDVTGSVFTDIGRIGVQYFGPGATGTFADNAYVGKGSGDFLDYAVEVGAGANVEIEKNDITNNLGVASSDGSTSAAILVTTFFGAGTTATIKGNNFSENTTAIAAGFDDDDTSTIFIDGSNHVESGENALVVRGNAVVDDAEKLKVDDAKVKWFAGNGDNNIAGNDGDDVLQGGGGNDMLTGGHGDDRFILNDNTGQDRITDFDRGADNGDVIDLSDNSSLNSFSEVQAAASQSGTDTVIDMGGGNTLILEHFKVNDLTADDFLF